MVSECIALSLFFGEVVGCGQVNTVTLECLFIIISFNVNTTQGARGVAGGRFSRSSARHTAHKGDNLHVRLSGISLSQSQGYDRGRSSIDHGSPLTDTRYRSKLAAPHEGSVLEQSLTNMKVSSLFVLERFAYTHTHTSVIRRANRSSKPERASSRTSRS